jgi:hypothetical protein
MGYPQSTLEEIIDSKRMMVHHGEAGYARHYKHARTATIYLTLFRRPRRVENHNLAALRVDAKQRLSDAAHGSRPRRLDVQSERGHRVHDDCGE